MLARVVHDDLTMEVWSSILQISGPIYELCFLGWKFPKTLSISLGHSLIASLAEPRRVPTIVVVPTIHQTPHRDFAAQNNKAAIARSGRFAGSHRKPGRIHEGDTYLLAALKEEISQLRDLLNLVNSGNLHHVRGIAARIRLLIVAGDPLPLLQMCAATIDKPLMMFTGANPAKKLALPLGIKPQLRLIFNGSPDPLPHLRNPVDLDVWLDFGAAQIGSESITNRALLKARRISP
jgi:hypothetical protein